MANFDIYDAGAATTPVPYQFPSPPITATQKVGPPAGHVGLPLSRAFDLRRPLSYTATERPRSNRGLLSALKSKAPLVAGDKIGLIVVPMGTRLESVQFEVQNPVAGVTVSLGGRFTGQAIGTVIDCSTVNRGSVDIAAAALKYNATQNEIIELTLATVPAAGLGELAILVSAQVDWYKNGG